MKKTYFQIFSYGCIAAFFLFWLAVLLLSMPSNKVKNYIAGNFPRFRYTFTSPWNLFSPPYLNHKRLYYIVMDSHHPGKADTLEVLQKLLLQKQKAAPFNQKENIIDHCLYYNVQGLISALWRGKEKPTGAAYTVADSLKMAQAISTAANDNQYLRCLASLQNYFTIVLKENKIDPAGKLVKILIIEKINRPFNEIKNLQFVPRETLVFESNYQPIRP